MDFFMAAVMNKSNNWWKVFHMVANEWFGPFCLNIIRTPTPANLTDVWSVEMFAAMISVGVFSF